MLQCRQNAAPTHFALPPPYIVRASALEPEPETELEMEIGTGNNVTPRRNDEIAAAHDDLAPRPRLSGTGSGIGNRSRKWNAEMELENGINRFLHGKTKIEIIFQSLYARKNENRIYFTNLHRNI